MMKRHIFQKTIEVYNEYRSTFNTLIELINREYDKALEVINKLDLIPDKAIMYDHFSVQIVEYLINLNEKAGTNFRISK